MSAEDPHVDPGQCGGNAAPYVLGALTDEEHEAFARHVESCAVCREEVAALRVVAAALPAAAPRVKAPPELKQRVMASVREDARERELARESQSAGEQREARAGRPTRRSRGGRSRAGLRGTGGWLSWRPGLAVGALAAAAIALAVVLATAGGSAHTRVIRAQVLVPRASASLSVSGGHAQLDIADMPQAGRGRVYEVWRRKALGMPQPTDALFTVSSSGTATVSVPGGVAGVREVLVTSEPEGGSRVPTRAPVIVARV